MSVRDRRGTVGCLILAFSLGDVSGGLAQAPPGAPAGEPGETAELDPIECWWRSSAEAVRIGEPFSLVLTCAVLETASTTVIPDRSRLDPSVLQMPPFEVTGGRQAADLRTGYRRFFQYEYTLRLISEDFGRDVLLPELTISYRVQSRVQPDSAVESREREYLLPSQPIRVLSLVPSGAADIRDHPAETFRDLEDRRFRARVLGVLAWSLFALGGVMLLWTAVRLLRRPREESALTSWHASDAALLRAAMRELDAVRRQRLIEGWTDDSAGQVLTVLRLAGSFVLSRPVTQVPVPPDDAADAVDGRLLVRSRGLQRKPVLVHSPVTAAVVARELNRPHVADGPRAERLASLHAAMTRFAGEVYGRPHGATDGPDLDEALASAAGLLRALTREHRWLSRKLSGIRRSAMQLRTRAWTR